MMPFSVLKELQGSSQTPHLSEQRKTNRGLVKSKNTKKKKVVQPSQLEHKKTFIEEYLESLKEYVHEEPICVILQDFISKAP